MTNREKVAVLPPPALTRHLDPDSLAHLPPNEGLCFVLRRRAVMFTGRDDKSQAGKRPLSAPAAHVEADKTAIVAALTPGEA